MTAPLSATRETVFITHAAPEDNEFALWLSSQLAMAGYCVWIDRRRLRGGDDTWDEIDRVLRNEAIKQVVVFTEHVGKSGVKKELGIGDVVGKRLKDPKFMIPIASAPSHTAMRHLNSFATTSSTATLTGTIA
jgi:hypothetical protein